MSEHRAGGVAAERIRIAAGGRILVDGVDLAARPGTLTAVVGPNGAGKSTLLRALAGIDRPEAGSVRFGSEDAFALPRRARARLAALVEQDATTDLDLTVRETVALGRLPHEGLWAGGSDERDRIVEESLAATAVTELAGRRITTLSGGERQRVLLAKALAQRTPLLLLDEPTNHLDIGAQLATLRVLRGLASGGATVLAALHDLSLAISAADSVVVLESGRVVAAGPTTEVLVPDLIRRVYGVEAALLTHPATGRPVLAVDLPVSAPTGGLPTGSGRASGSR